jgi:hypothetical protein
MRRPAQRASGQSCHFDFEFTTAITPQVIMRGGLAFVSVMSHQPLPRSAVATVVMAHDAGAVTEMSGGYFLPSPHFFKCRACPLPRALPTSPLTSSLALPSPTRPCRPLAVSLPATTRFRRGARRGLRCRRWRRPRLGSMVAQRGATTRAPWRLSRRRPLPQLPPLPHPRRLELPAARVSQKSGSPAARRGVGRSPLPRRLLLLCRLTAAGGRRAARTRKPLLSSRSPPLPRGPAWRLLLR